MLKNSLHSTVVGNVLAEIIGQGVHCCSVNTFFSGEDEVKD